MKTESLAGLLRPHPLLGDLDPADLDQMAGCGRNVHFLAGETIFAVGQPADHFYLLRHGRVAFLHAT